MTTGSIRGYIEHYFAPHPSQEVRELFVSTAILNFAVSSISLFEPLYLHAVGGFPLWQVLLIYASVYVLYFFLLPLGGRICRRHGYEHTILFSSPFLILYYLALFATAWHQSFAVVTVLALVMQKILYWPGYHSNFATFGNKAEQGREVSNMTAIAGLVAVIAPAFGGMIIGTFGYPTLFVGVAALILLSNVPLLRTPELFAPQPFAYVTALKRPFQKPQRRHTLAFMGFGEEFLALVAWPLFMALVIRNITSLGLVVSLAMLVNIGAVLYIGRMSDEGDRGAVLRSGVLFDVLSWLVRPFTGGGLGVFLMDSFYRVSKNMLGVPLLSMVYDDARDQHAAMENIIHFEMALSIGKAVAGFSGALILWAFPNGWTAIFVLGAAFASLYAFMAQPTRMSKVEAPPPQAIAPAR